MNKTRLIFLSIFLFSCNLIEYHPYDGQTELSNINETNIALIESVTKAKEEFKFIWMGDTQRFYNETEDFVKYVNENLDVDFVLHGGDITDFGMTDEFEWVHNIMSELNVPYIALIGNHDILATGDEVYEQIYGNTNFNFTVGDIRFICLNTNQLEYEENSDVPNFAYINSQLASTTTASRTIVAMHAAPNSEQINEEDGKAMHETIKNFEGLMFCINAHAHKTSIDELYDDGVIYYTCATIGLRSFILFTITKNGYEYEEIFY